MKSLVCSKQIRDRSHQWLALTPISKCPRDLQLTINDSNQVHEVFTWLQSSDTHGLPNSIRLTLQECEDSELQELIDQVVAEQDLLGENQHKTKTLFQEIAARLVALDQVAQADANAGDSPVISTSLLRETYDQLEVNSPLAAPHVLQMLAIQRTPEAMQSLAEALLASPPSDWQAVGLALSPLWRANASLIEEFFDALGNEFVHPATMAVLLDLANYCSRTKRLERHPWAVHRTRLEALLKSVAVRLERLEEAPQEFGESVEEIQQTLGESVALTISLCDALGIIGDKESSDVLKTTLDLSHRRVQTEAAAALALIGDEVGKSRLIELAADRVARMRAVAYAEELGFAEEIDEKLKMPEALAESELAAWLAGAEQFGFPPTSIELIDSKSLFWPGFDQPQSCFLFRYEYHLPDGSMSNVGIAGPCAHSFHTDLANLPLDDIYAAFAGWHVEHDEIFEVPATELNLMQRDELEKLSTVLEAEKIDEQTPIALAFFLGEIAVVAHGKREGKEVIAITDGNELLCYQTSPNPKSMSPDVALCIFRGRKMLRSFNE